MRSFMNKKSVPSFSRIIILISERKANQLLKMAQNQILQLSVFVLLFLQIFLEDNYQAYCVGNKALFYDTQLSHSFMNIMIKSKIINKYFTAWHF